MHWKLLLPWALRAWPFLSLIPVALCHYAALHFFSSAALVNKVLGSVLQISGAVIVLYSINDNLGLFRELSLKKALGAWMRAFPLKRPPVTLSVSGASHGHASAVATLSVAMKATTVEERVAELERKLAEVEKQMHASIDAVHARIHQTRTELLQKVDSNILKAS